MKTELKRQIIRARDHKISDEERREQIISFAYGNIKLHNPGVTREEIIKQYDALKTQN